MQCDGKLWLLAHALVKLYGAVKRRVVDIRRRCPHLQHFLQLFTGTHIQFVPGCKSCIHGDLISQLLILSTMFVLTRPTCTTSELFEYPYVHALWGDEVHYGVPSYILVIASHSPDNQMLVFHAICGLCWSSVAHPGVKCDLHLLLSTLQHLLPVKGMYVPHRSPSEGATTWKRRWDDCRSFSNCACCPCLCCQPKRKHIWVGLAHELITKSSPRTKISWTWAWQVIQVSDLVNRIT